ncbi:MAG: SIS domain-containing protein [Armatimonadota bacterium]
MAQQSAAARYLARVEALVRIVAEQEAEAIETAAQTISSRAADGHLVHTLGCGHSSLLAQEVFYRSGGLMLVNCIFAPGQSLSERPVTITTQMERLPGLAAAALEGADVREGDVLIVISSSGRNVFPVEAALEGKRRGCFVIAVTSKTIAQSTTSRHESGRMLADVADLILDNKVIPGDSCVELEGFPQTVGATSTVAGALLLQAVMARAIELMVEAGQEPPVFINANVEGGSEHNQRVIARYRDRLRHLL